MNFRTILRFSVTICATTLPCAFSPFAKGADYYVNAHGIVGGNTYTDLQTALNDVPAGTAADPTRLFLAPGIYDSQQITLKASKPYIDLIGTGAQAADTVVEYGLTAKSVVGGVAVNTDGSSTVEDYANNFTAANLTFANTTPQAAPGGSSVQALAFLSSGDENAFSDVNFVGFQDTLYLGKGRYYFNHCAINGTVDYIFGKGTAVFQNSTINSAGNTGGACTITAADTDPRTAVGFVFLNSTLTGNPTPVSEGGNLGYQAGVPDGNGFLGRAWKYDSGSNSSVTYINTKMSPVINAQGWTLWNAGEIPSQSSPRYSEYNSMDLSGNPLDISSRVPWSNQLVYSGNPSALKDAANYTLAHIFGPENFWGSQYTNTFALGGTWNPLPQIAATAVVSPGTLATLAGGMGALFFMRRKFRRS